MALISAEDYISKLSGRLARLRRIGLIYDFGHNNSSVGFVMQKREQFVVTCKDCQRAIPTGAKEFPFHSVEVTCPLCGKQHRYLPSEVILGRPNELAAKKLRA
jgi:RNase P subunit RPR2